MSPRAEARKGRERLGTETVGEGLFPLKGSHGWHYANASCAANDCWASASPDLSGDVRVDGGTCGLGDCLLTIGIIDRDGKFVTVSLRKEGGTADRLRRTLLTKHRKVRPIEGSCKSCCAGLHRGHMMTKVWFWRKVVARRSRD